MPARKYIEETIEISNRASTEPQYLFSVINQFAVKVMVELTRFLAVQNSSIGDLVTHSVTHSTLMVDIEEQP